jgi:transaldolase
MKFFIDTADISEIQALSETGFVDGVTTNPSLIAKSGRNILEVIKEICDLVPGPVSAEVTATDFPTMMKEADKLAALADNVTIKVPLTVDGLKACRAITSNGRQVNVTLCFSASQALLAAKAGATYISPFVGRLDDLGENGMDLIADIVQMYDVYPELDTQVLVASIRSLEHVELAGLIGAHVSTLPPKIVWDMYNHELTDKGLNAFLEDWKKTGQSIL